LRLAIAFLISTDIDANSRVSTDEQAAYRSGRRRVVLSANLSGAKCALGTATVTDDATCRLDDSPSPPGPINHLGPRPNRTDAREPCGDHRAAEVASGAATPASTEPAYPGRPETAEPVDHLAPARVPAYKTKMIAAIASHASELQVRSRPAPCAVVGRRAPRLHSCAAPLTNPARRLHPQLPDPRAQRGDPCSERSAT
jgi:hypothetical protein